MADRTDGPHRNITLWLEAGGSAGAFRVRAETVDAVGVPAVGGVDSRLPDGWASIVDRLAFGQLDLPSIDALAESLADALLAGEIGRFVGRSYERLRGLGHRVRLRLVCNDPVLAAVPWELARPLTGFDDQAFWENPALSLTRLEPGQRAVGAVPIDGRLGATVIEQPRIGGRYPALPSLLDRWVDSAEHDDEIKSDGRQHLSPLIEIHAATGAQDLADRMASGRDPLLVVFGHADFVEEEVQLLAPGPSGPEPVAAGSLAGAAIRRQPVVAVVMACRTGQRARTENPEPQRWAGPAMTLVRAGVPYVIATQHVVRVDAGEAFVRTVLDELGAGADVDRAVMAGRQAMRSAVPDRHWPQAWLPVLYALDSEPGGRARPFRVTHEVNAGQVGEVVGAEGVPDSRATDLEVVSRVVADRIDKVVGWKPEPRPPG